MGCKHCDYTGFFNLHLVPQDELRKMAGEPLQVVEWIAAHPGTEVKVCECLEKKLARERVRSAP